MIIDGLREYSVNSYFDCLQLLRLGEKNRCVKSTFMNALSSRSHTIFYLTLESKKKDTNGK